MNAGKTMDRFPIRASETVGQVADLAPINAQIRQLNELAYSRANQQLPLVAMPARPPHLQRLGQVWLKNPIYFLTTCTYQRRCLLADPQVMMVLVAE